MEEGNKISVMNLILYFMTKSNQIHNAGHSRYFKGFKQKQFKTQISRITGIFGESRQSTVYKSMIKK